ncbi:MAG: hypothetical protein FIB08_04140 [Candidatus Methanoperedens sp.]|nr:hypothetical protein [Candidatus Methanoperedens sp.]
MKKCKFCGKEFKRNGVLFHELHCEKNYDSPMKGLWKGENRPMIDLSKPTIDLPKDYDSTMEEKGLSKDYDRPIKGEKKPMDSPTIDLSKDDDPEYNMIQIKPGVYQCENCGTCYDSIESRCQICGVRFE